MRPIEPAELSAFIDEELDAARAAEVRAALATDEALRSQYEALLLADAHLKSVAAGMTLTPRIRWPPPAAAAGVRFSVGLWRFLPVFLIPAAWLIRNLTDADVLALAVSALALITLMVSVVLVVLRDDDGPSALALSNDSGDLS